MIQSAIEQGRLILGQIAMKVDTQPFPSVNMVEGYDRSMRRQLDFALGINMAGSALRRHTRNEESDPCDRPQKGKKGYITEEQIRHVRNQRPASSDLSKSMSTSTSNVSNASRRRKSMNTVLGKV
jgi:hypothetical protein